MVPHIIAANPRMVELVDSLERVARSGHSVLIIGETGTGKELIADTLVAHSERRGAPFVKVSPAAVPAELFESELFGHVKGSFTGAVAGRKGLFAQADGGTVYLDDIDDFPLNAQAKVLRVLESHDMRRVGSDTDVKVNVRLISSTKRDLLQLVAEGRFRADLYYRINVVRLRIPPLRERLEDIMPICRIFLPPGLHYLLENPELRRMLHGHSWPGNVRELRNVAHRLSMVRPDDDIPGGILPDLLDCVESGPSCSNCIPQLLAGGDPLTEIMKRLEEQMICYAIEQASGNRTDAARRLGIPRSTLIDRMARLGLSTSRFNDV
jgi:DNA-binding NtrC family response regulator